MYFDSDFAELCSLGFNQCLITSWVSVCLGSGATLNLNHWWPRPPPYGITRPHWVQILMEMGPCDSGSGDLAELITTCGTGDDWISLQSRIEKDRSMNSLGCLVFSMEPVQKGGEASAKVMGVWGLNTLRPRKMADISQTTFSNVFSTMKMFEFWFKFHWSLFLRVQLKIFQHWLG